MAGHGERFSVATINSPRTILVISPAQELYANAAYRRLVDRLGPANVYVLSAGWGLICANFLTPHYDITFSPIADRYKRRLKTDQYDDFCMLPSNVHEQILFFGSKDYLPLFYKLTASVRSQRIVLYKSASTPKLDGYTFVYFNTPRQTNWHYAAVDKYLAGHIQIE
jgi:hypothetical protein